MKLFLCRSSLNLVNLPYLLPNTLCHIALQAPLGRTVFGNDRLLFILIACIIPDLPWILLKCLLPLDCFDPYDLRLYCTAQASLLFCLVFSAALAACCRQSGTIFLVLGSNCLFHLLLDGLEIKWGNGVHLVAPWSWTMMQFGLVWPEHPAILFSSLAGLLYLLYLLYNRGNDRDCTMRLHLPGKAKTAVAVFFLFCYILAPLFFLEQMEKADTYNIHTLRMQDERPGKPLAFDRVHYFSQQQTLQTFAGERIIIIGSQPASSGRVSFRGLFLTPTSFLSTQHHFHRDGRDFATFIGLFLTCTLLLQSLLLPHFQTGKNNQGPP